MWFFSGNCLMRGCFCWSRHVVLSWRQSGKRPCDVLLEQMLERTHDVWKGYKYNPTVWHWFALPFFAGQHLLWRCRKKCMEELLVIFQWLPVAPTDSSQLAEPRGFFWIELTLLIHEWCLWGDQAMAADLCELNCWYPDNADWIHHKELFLNRSTSSFALLTLAFHSLWWLVG